MKAVIQRVKSASVTIHETEKGAIQSGLLVYLGIDERDTEADLRWLINKTAQIRIFPDERGQMNRNITDAKGDFLIISQFTLIASTKKGHRPSYTKAALPEKAIPLYNRFIEGLRTFCQCSVESGEFGADMKVFSVNDGPVTIVIDSLNRT